MSDRLARAIADTGGCIGINFYNEFIDQAYCDAMAARPTSLLKELNQPTSFRPEQMDQAAAERARHFFRDAPPRPRFDLILDHIDHLVNVVGADHVGIGADLDSCMIPVPEGIDSVRDYPKLTEGLVRRGYPDDVIEKIMGGNFLRVFTEVRGG